MILATVTTKEMKIKEMKMTKDPANGSSLDRQRGQGVEVDVGIARGGRPPVAGGRLVPETWTR